VLKRYLWNSVDVAVAGLLSFLLLMLMMMILLQWGGTDAGWTAPDGDLLSYIPQQSRCFVFVLAASVRRVVNFLQESESASSRHTTNDLSIDFYSVGTL
jgi:hypothetical protein